MSSFSPPAWCGVGSCWPFLEWPLCLFLGHLRFSAACPAAGYPWRVPQLLAPVSWPTPAVDVCCRVGGVLVHHLVFYLVPAQLPLPQLTLYGFCNLSGSSLLAYSCGGALLLGWGCLWCVAWFSTLCRALAQGPAVCTAYPAAGSLGDFLPFLSPGACPSATLVV